MEKVFEQMQLPIHNYTNDSVKVTCCFTGHRIHKLPWRDNEDDERCVSVKRRLRAEIIYAIEQGYTQFISGMALGFDTMCVEILLNLKQTYPQIKILGALPCRNQDKFWTAEQKMRYAKLLEQLDSVQYISEEYEGAESMYKRNRQMINSSSLVIALYDDLTGGTLQAINYAKKQRKRVIMLKI